MARLRLGVVLGVAVAVVGVSVPSATLAGRLAWSEPHLRARVAPLSNTPNDGVSCPSSTLCVIRDSAGGIGLLRNPQSREATRTAYTLPGIHGLGLLDCPSINLCVAADADGHVLISTDPTSGPGAWSVTNLAGGRSLQLLTCPSASLCVAADDQGNLVTSAAPAGGVFAWVTTSMPVPITSLSCTPSTWCVAIDSSGHVLSSTDPTGGTSAWIESGAPALPPSGPLSCSDQSLCVLASGGTVYTTASPVGDAKWAAATVDGGNTIESLACPTSSLCFAGDNAGELLFSTNPNAGAGAWSAVNVDGANAIADISCPSSDVCVGADGEFHALAWTSPIGGRIGFGILEFPGFDAFTSLACPSMDSCVGVDGFGDHFVTSSRPAGSWRVKSVTRGIGESPQVWRVACATRSLCLALVTDMGPPGASGAAGTLYSFDPLGGPHAFRRLRVRGAERSIGFEEVSCLPGPVCAAVDVVGHVFTSADPARAGTWKRDRSRRRWFAISCPTRRLCVALHSDPGRVVSTGEPPTYATATPGGSIDVFRDGVRRTLAIDPGNGLTGVSCASSSLCIAVDSGGNVLTSDNPAGRWNAVHADSWPLVAVACPSRRLCVAVDQGGRVLVAHGP